VIRRSPARLVGDHKSPPWYQSTAPTPDRYAVPMIVLSSSCRLRSAVSAATSSPSSGSVRLPFAGLRLFDADPVLDQDPGLIDGERPGPQVDI
jgi:hypothetical protein